MTILSYHFYYLIRHVHLCYNFHIKHHALVLYIRHQCIKVTPLKGNQILIWGLQNLFMLEETHFFEMRFFLTRNILVQADKKPSTHVYLVNVSLADFIMPIANCPPPLPMRFSKYHKSPVASTSTMKSTPKGMLVPL